MAVGEVAHRRTWLLVDRYLALNSALGDELVAAGIPAARVTMLPNTAADPGPATPPGSDVLFVGRLDEAKGVRLLLDAWPRVDARGTRLVIVGDGPLRAEVQEHARRVPFVEFRGFLGRAELDACYRDAGVVVVPSITPEAFGLVAVEALAHGRPVVATRAGALPDVIGDRAGVLADVDSESLAAALTTILRGDLAPFAAAARARYETRYAPDIVTPQLLSVYENVIAARRVHAS